MAGPQSPNYRAEPVDQLLTVPLDAMTLIYQRRSGITHIVAEPIPEILEIMGNDSMDASMVTERLAARFDLQVGDATAIIESRLDEMAQLGLVERVRA